MKLNIIVSFFILSYLLTAGTPEQLFNRAVNKTLNVNYISYNITDKIKYLEAAQFISDTMYVIAKRNRRIPYINALLRIQYENGNVTLFTGKEYKSLDVDEKTLFVVDTSQGALYYLQNAGIPQLLQKHLASVMSRLSFEHYKFIHLNDTTLDGQLCKQIAIFSKVNTPISEDSNTKAVFDSTVVAVSEADTMLRRYYRAVSLDNGDTQIEEQLFTNVRAGIRIDDIMFDISLPEGYAYKSPTPAGKRPELLPLGSIAPKWVLADEKDKEYRLSDYAGKVVVMDFWGTWCKWCLKAMPMIQKVHKYYNNEVIILGISCQEPHNAAPKKFMDDKGFTYQLLVQGDEVAKHYKVKGFPTLYVIGKDGKIAWYFVGYSDNLDAELKKIIEKELAK